MTCRLYWLSLLALALGLGCVGSPQPSPPNLAPEGVSRRGNAADIMDGVMIDGDPGTVSPPEGAVVVTNLDRDDRPVSEPVRADGSFELSVEGLPSDEYRVQVRNGAARSTPLDVVGDALTPALDPAPRPLAGCFVVTPAFELDLGEVRVGEDAARTLELSNGCPDPVSFDVSVRELGAPVSIDVDPRRVAPGASVELTLRLTPTEPGSEEITVFIEATAPMRDRRPLTVFFRGVE